jgi:integrase/recombinase XerD
VLSLALLIADFLADQKNAGRSPHTLRACASDLAQLAASHSGPTEELTVERLRAFWTAFDPLSPATRARKQAAVASFLAWAYRHDYIPADPMTKIDRIRREPDMPRGVGRETIDLPPLRLCRRGRPRALSPMS